ncbi:unnamed protein product [Eruca vesicaria subsp. sativa]|uniref:Defensin-like protein n=1 Tax=Eruca vesicaria subsp. sativa TaxID=29727 RepID=A0ABC8LGJ2_ERUVS|nr:unnamed protein product [Eruca vesicaria subsp. sativa]
MAKAASSLALPIIFLVLFSLGEQNMGWKVCDLLIGPCAKFPDCDNSCRDKLGPDSNGFCDIKAKNYCHCKYDCLNDKTPV